ncbi:zinc finger protein OZF-like [Periplaneta americana]|uniref:zinc finger protein OZF-like n=1 Tax=Periplaneta americana TaxID=6978 RepID=UPI0037E8C372
MKAVMFDVSVKSEIKTFDLQVNNKIVKECLSTEAHLSLQHKDEIKVKCGNIAYDLLPVQKCEETPIPILFPAVKCKPQEKSCDVDIVKDESVLDVTTTDDGLPKWSINLHGLNDIKNQEGDSSIVPIHPPDCHGSTQLDEVCTTHEDCGPADNFSSRKKLDLHLQFPDKSHNIHQNVEQQINPNLGMRFTECEENVTGLVEDMSLHTDLKHYKCDICDETFKEKTKFDIHKSEHTNLRSHICDICQKTFTQGRLLRTHKFIHTDEKPSSNCHSCDKGYTRSRDIIEHMYVNTGEGPYVCNICKTTFTQKQSLVVHSLQHTCERPYKCNFCEKSFTQKQTLIAHTLQHKGERPYKCNFCEKDFTERQALIKHVLHHSGQRPYKCNFCENSFTQKQTLVVHSLQHTGERPFKCHFCDKTFSQRHHLSTHILTHTGENPFRCVICGKSYTLKAKLVAHKLTHMSNGK